MTASAAEDLFAEARRILATNVSEAISAAEKALTHDPAHPGVLDFLATTLVARRRKFEDGLAYADRLVLAAPADAGAWYTRGWCYEFAAHELSRRPSATTLDTSTLYAEAEVSFRRCLSLAPDGKLRDDAEDLLEHVENVRSP